LAEQQQVDAPAGLSALPRRLDDTPGLTVTRFVVKTGKPKTFFLPSHIPQQKKVYLFQVKLLHCKVKQGKNVA